MATDSASPRLLSIDAFRGATVVGMILVNNPGDWSTVFPPLLHATWHGWTPTDLIFPFFLFLVGVSIVLALGRRLEEGTARAVILAKVARRSMVLFALGLFLSGYPFGLFGTRTFAELLETWRIPGVLQRIALCYLIAAALYVLARRRTLIAITAILLVGYALAMAWIPVPADDGGWVAPDLDSKRQHIAGWVDRTLLGRHVWVSSKVYDPEGLLSTLPAVATTLLGVFAGLLVRRRDRSTTETIARLFVLGTGLAALGHIWSWIVPINKPLWTSSYATFTAGLACCGLALAMFLFDDSTRDRAPRAQWARPWVRFGQNAIVVFVGSGVLARTLGMLTFEGTSLQRLLFGHALASWLPPYVASLGYAILWVMGWYAVLVWMDRRNLVIRV